MYLKRKGYVEMKEKSSQKFNEEIPTSNSNNNNNNNLDRHLYNELDEIVLLIQSLIETKPNNSFTRRVPLNYTKTPKDSRKNGIKSLDGKKHEDKEQGNDSKSDHDKDREELNALRKQLEELQQQLLEKDELLKVAEVSKSQVSLVESQLDELKRNVAEKDSLIKSSQSQLNDAKIKLADKQAALEKLQWETMTSNQKVEKLQQELESMHSQVSSLMLIFEGLSKETPVTATDYDVTPYFPDHLFDIDELDENEIQNMEEAREAYLAAVELAKEKQDEESLLAASRARFYLQSFVFRTKAQT